MKTKPKTKTPPKASVITAKSPLNACGTLPVELTMAECSALYDLLNHEVFAPKKFKETNDPDEWLQFCNVCQNWEDEHTSTCAVGRLARVRQIVS